MRDNGSFRFDGKQPTLASTLKAAGYRTAAFVGAFVLDARFGLNAGFDVYDDRYGARPAGGDLSLVERPANAVLDPAVEWMAAAESPWFAWAHLYDPHEPYEPPEPFRSRFAADPYAGEIAFADARLGLALDELSRARTARQHASSSSPPTTASRSASTRSGPTVSSPTTRRCGFRSSSGRRRRSSRPCSMGRRNSWT